MLPILYASIPYPCYALRDGFLWASRAADASYFNNRCGMGLSMRNGIIYLQARILERD